LLRSGKALRKYPDHARKGVKQLHNKGGRPGKEAPEENGFSCWVKKKQAAGRRGENLLPSVTKSNICRLSEKKTVVNGGGSIRIWIKEKHTIGLERRKATLREKVELCVGVDEVFAKITGGSRGNRELQEWRNTTES